MAVINYRNDKKAFMNKQVFETEKEAAEYIVGIMENIIIKKPDALLCLAAGHTSIPVFNKMIAEQKSGRLPLKNAKFVAMDEWAKVPEENMGSCTNFLYRNCFMPLGLDKSQICTFDSFAGQEECDRIHGYCEENGGIDFLLLGMGMNGHLALNEPGSERYSTARVVELSETTKQVSPKYFGDANIKVTHGLTLGLEELLNSRKMVLAVFGEHKKEIVRKFEQSEITKDFPASFIKEIDNAKVVYDSAAALII